MPTCRLCMLDLSEFSMMALLTPSKAKVKPNKWKKVSCMMSTIVLCYNRVFAPSTNTIQPPYDFGSAGVKGYLSHNDYIFLYLFRLSLIARTEK
jgi:hypothetical protein